MMMMFLVFLAWIQSLDDDDVFGVLSLDSRPWNKAYGLRDWKSDAFGNAYEVSVRCRARVKAEPPSV
nr:hypothetical protein [Tanacetum cinerariifolium]